MSYSQVNMLGLFKGFASTTFKNPQEHLRTFNINQDASRVFREERLQGSNGE